MNFDSADFLLKTSANFEADVKGEYVRDSCEKSNVAEFERSFFSLIENEDDFNSAMRREINFHLRVIKGVMS